MNQFTVIQITPDELSALIKEAISSALSQQKPPDTNKPMRMDEAAKYLGIAKQTLYCNIGAGKIRPNKVGKHNLFFKEDLDALIRGNNQAIDGSAFLKRREIKSTNHLYVVKNSNGFIKVGVANNLSQRLADLKKEFTGEWKVVFSSLNNGHIEKSIHAALAEHKLSIQKKNGKISHECFKSSDAVLKTIKSICV